MIRDDWSLTKLPPEGHGDVGPFFWSLVETSVQEKERLSLHDRWRQNYKLRRGGHLSGKKTRSKIGAIKRLMVNLIGANINRTVANITARAPVAEVVDLDGLEDQADKALTGLIRKWNNESEQARLLSRSVLNMETYGITVEKGVYDATTGRTQTVIIDPFAFIVAPGYFDECQKVPYVGHIEETAVDAVKLRYGVSGGKKLDELHDNSAEADVLGKNREELRPDSQLENADAPGLFPGSYTTARSNIAIDDNDYAKKTLVAELWVRDWSEETFDQPEVDEMGNIVLDAETGEPIVTRIKQTKYPGGWRVVIIANAGELVLYDGPNPNINPAIPRELTQHTYLYKNHPYYWSNSYEDTTSIWGFAAAEQVGDINLKINEMLSRLAQYLNRAVSPPLILPRDSGVKLSDISNSPTLVLRPTSTAVASGIRFMPVPNLPSNFFDAINLYISLFDRASQIEDADRGVAPSGVIAASAIVSLQERNQVMIQAKIMSVDYLVRQRGRIAISNLQNFGVQGVQVDVDGTPAEVVGVNLVGRQFNYVVESGSTVAKTTVQIQEQAQALYQAGAIDRQALLETLNFPGWKSIVERVGEGQLAQAMQILIQAGLPEEEAQQLQQYLMEPQGGPGDKPQTGGASTPQPGVPKTQQGGQQ